MDQIKIIQHNIIKWTTPRRNELYNYYIKEDPDVIMLNSTGMTSIERIKMYTYNVYQRNNENEQHAGIAIAVKHNIKHKIYDDFEGDTLAIELETNRGPILLATTYWPPRRNEVPIQDITNIMRKQIPVYLIGDCNAKHPFVGHSYSNLKGRLINNLISNNTAVHLGPEFPTMIHYSTVGRPDIILANRHCYFNYTIRQGNLTTSDHIPVVFTIGSKPIVTENKKIYRMNKTDWDKYKNVMEKKLEEQVTHIEGNTVNQDHIDLELENWPKIINETKEEVIPTRQFKIAPHPKESDLLKLLQRNYREIKRYVAIQGMTAETRHRIRILQEEIKEESKRIHTEQARMP